MATTIYLRDLIFNPGVSKTASVDLTELVPSGNDGDEKWVTVVSTTAKDFNAASIQNIYGNCMKRGFSKSSGFLKGPYTVASPNNVLSLVIDGVSANVTLEEGINLTGTAVASDIEDKIIAVGDGGGAQEGNLSFLAANCSFTDGVFKIESGTLSDKYTGTSRTSVEVASSGTVNSTLGFNLPTESSILTGRVIPESALATTFVASGTSVVVSSAVQMEANRAYVITDGTNTDYFIATVVVSGTNTLTVAAGAIPHGYTVVSGTANVKVQMLAINDPDPEPKSPLVDLDAVVRFCISSIQRQIDFSS